ncbi:MAG TPA: M1 family metallopeptidase, partial [Bacteroidota bacterium]|nr:M1 family metallopeptidase [Bacteroidota bacterium]
PDSMTISITVPKGLEDVSNGRLRAVTELPNRWTRYDWFVSVPINNYDVTINIGKFTHWHDVYNGITGDTLSLNYYTLPENVARAKEQFKDVKRMLEAFERYFGPYPFYRDGYKLIESPHNGMEHQTAVAYGNRYTMGYRGRASSPVGLKFDFIIVHESAHEWWGNSITSKDVADMWIHESFGAYAEALFVEYWYGRDQSLAYINGKKWNVRNDSPIIGTYNVQNEGSGDMYDKGQLVLNTLRSVIDNDSLWFTILRGMQKTYKYQTITADTIINYVNAKTGKDLAYFFDQYLRHTKVPELDLFVSQKGNKTTLRYRWNTEVQDFHMPIKVTTADNKLDWITPTKDWQTLPLGDMDPSHFKVADNLFYVNAKISTSYIDPNMESN